MSNLAVHRLDIVAEETEGQRGGVVWRRRGKLASQEVRDTVRPVLRRLSAQSDCGPRRSARLPDARPAPAPPSPVPSPTASPTRPPASRQPANLPAASRAYLTSSAGRPENLRESPGRRVVRAARELGTAHDAEKPAPPARPMAGRTGTASTTPVVAVSFPSVAARVRSRPSAFHVFPAYGQARSWRACRPVGQG